MVDFKPSTIKEIRKIIITTFKYSSFKIEYNQLDIFGY